MKAKPTAELLKEQLHHFLTSIKQVNPSSYTTDDEKKIYQEFKDLHTAYSTKSKTWIDDNFSPLGVRKIHCLELGLTNNQVFSDIVALMEKDNATTTINVINFIKSDQGREAITKGNLGGLTDGEVIEFFGSVFGVRIADACLKSLKAEKLGSILGYALSGKFEQDFAEFMQTANSNGTEQPNNAKTRKNKASKPRSINKEELTTWLETRIATSDFRLRYKVEEGQDRFMVNGGLVEDDNRQTENQVRGPNCPDHAFYNKASNLLLVGLSTANPDVATQKTTHAKVLAAAKLIAENTLPANTTVQGYLLLTGRFPTEGKTREGNKFRGMLEEGNSEQPEEAIKTILQMSYLALYGNTNTARQALTLAEFNPFIAGCNTLDLYLELSKIKTVEEPVEKNKALRQMITRRLTKTVDILNRTPLKNIHGVQGQINQYLADITNIYQKLPLNFPHPMEQNEWNREMVPLNQAIDEFNRKMNLIGKEDSLANQQTLRRTKKLLSTIQNYNEEVVAARETTGEAKPIEWVGRPKLTTKKTFTEEEIIQFGETLQKNMGPIPAQKFAFCLEMLKLRFNGVSPENVWRHMEGEFTRRYANRGSVKVTKKLAIQKLKWYQDVCTETADQCKYTRALKFIQTTNYLLWKDGRCAEAVKDKALELFEFMNKTLAEMGFADKATPKISSTHKRHNGLG